MSKPEMILFLSDARGVYIPRDFATSWDSTERARRISGVSDEDWAVLEAGPDSDGYWDVWLEVEENAVVTDDNGVKFFVYQEGDCWLVPVGMDWDDETETWVWPDDADNVVPFKRKEQK